MLARTFIAAAEPHQAGYAACVHVTLAFQLFCERQLDGVTPLNWRQALWDEIWLAGRFERVRMWHPREVFGSQVQTLLNWGVSKGGWWSPERQAYIVTIAGIEIEHTAYDRL